MPRILTPSDIAQFRSRLCDVAAALFAEQGESGFNMRELAKQLGVDGVRELYRQPERDAGDIRSGGRVMKVLSPRFACGILWKCSKDLR